MRLNVKQDVTGNCVKDSEYLFQYLFNYYILIYGFLSAVSVGVMRLLKEDYAPLFSTALW